MCGRLHWFHIVLRLTIFSQITQDPFIVQKCVLLVLRPDLFLPDDRPLLINTNCALRTPGGPPLARSGRSSWVSYYSNNTPFLVDSNDHSYWHFEFKSLRQPTDSLSVFSLLVNANSKLQNIKHQINDPILISYATIIEATVGAIFHVPEGLQNQDSPVPSNLPTPCPSITDPGPSTKHHGDRGDYKQDSMDLDHQDGSGAKEDHIDSYINSDEPSDEDDDPDMVNGLTFPEMRMVLQQVSDGRISDQERAEAAMLMLGMAGGKVLLFFSAPHSFLIPTTRPQTFTGSLSIGQRLFVDRLYPIQLHEVNIQLLTFCVE